MKRFLTSATFLICSLLTTFAQFSGSGNGTEDDPYLIYNENQLSQMVNFLNQEGVVFKLMKDLNLTNWITENNPSQGWMPVGVTSSPFKGKFLGNNHKISGLSIKRSTEENVGFFGYLDGAIIQDLTVEGSVVSGKNYVGGIAGQSVSSTISNVSITLTGAAGVTGSNNVGGFAGKVTNGTFNGFNANTMVNATTLAGGLIGTVSGGTYQNGNAEGNITVTQGSAGGFAGKGNNYEITDIQVVGNIQCTASGCVVGGMVATSESTAKLTNCTVIGNLSAQESDNVGAGALGGALGFIKGGSSVTLNTCFSKGKLNHTGDYTGGIVGKSEGACIANMESCSHFGDITGKDYVGGLIGAMLSADVKPTLSTYQVYNSNSTSNGAPSGTLLQTTQETIVNGSAVTASINNCTSIGNIAGESWVGGLIGSDLSSYGYSPKAKTANCSSSSLNKYLFKDGVYTGTYNKNATLSYTYYDYSRNSVSHSLTNNYYSGTIHGTNYVGGLVGLKGGGELKNNYAYANIYGDANVGGIVGSTTAQTTLSSYSVTTIKSNVANCQTISATTSDLGRVYGSIAGDSYTTIGALGSAEGNRGLAQSKLILQGVVQEVEDHLQNGTSIGPSLLKLKATYVSMGWNFDDNWNMLETECYPYKKYQAAPPVIESDLVSQATSISGRSINGGTVYLYYKDRDAVSTECDGHDWTFDTEALQSGAFVQIYADVEGMTPSYFTTTSVGYPGSGTEEDPYRIYTAEDLQGASNRGYYKLMNDIDLTQWINENSPTEGWPAIGRNSGEATYIDGDGHKVTGLWMNTTQNFNGLFSNFSAGQIKNLTVEVATGKKVKGGDYTGILIGRNANGRLVNCTVKGDVEGTGHVGGLVGYVENTTVSAITADASIIGTSYVGGITGEAVSCTFSATSADANINGMAYVGGVTGQAMDCTLTNCNAVTTIVSSGADSKVGGLVGYAKGGSVSKCSAQNNLTAADESNYVGGLVGYSETPINLAFSTGSVAATGSGSYSGGLVGYALSPIENCYSTANAAGTLFTAGLVGYTFSSIDKCYAKGDVNGVMYGGGVVGELDGSAASISNSIACCNTLSLTAQSSWGSRVIGGFKNGAAEPGNTNYALSTMQVSLNNVPQTKTDDSVEGIAKTGAELMQANTYMNIGWDFSEVWGIDEGEIYPYLLWEIDINPVVDISFDKTSILIAVGKNESIAASVLPLGATNKRLNWTSSNTAVATVDDGVVTAVAVGTATVTATSTDGSNISATCQVTVTANHDDAIAALQSIVDRAQALYDNSTEGENIGEYAPGSRAALLAVINNIRTQISSTMSDATITQCTNEINAAIGLFQSMQVTAGEDTDYSTIDNTIYLERMEAASGSQVTLSVKMKNTVDIQGYQFDLYLPEGVTIATDEDGFSLIELSTERTTSRKTDYFNSTVQPDGSIRVLCGSSKGYTFEGVDGEVALITLNIDENMEEGDHPIILKEVNLTDRNSELYTTDYLKSTLTIINFIVGDVNGNKKVEVADFIATANYILGNPPQTFLFKAGDLNGNSSIEVSDFIGIANIILNSSSSTDAASTPNKAPKKSVTDVSLLSDAIYVEPVTATPGTLQTLSVQMKNSAPVAGYQFTLKLPDGITVATDEDNFLMAELSTERTTSRKTDYFNSSLQADGTLKVLCGTSTADPNTGKPYVFSGNEGEVALVTISIPAGFEPGTYEISVLDAAFSDADNTLNEIGQAVTSELTIGDGYVLLDENSTTAPVAATGVDVRVRRTINADVWSTICLPFAMSDAQVKDVFGDDVKLADFKGYDVTEDGENIVGITVNFEAATAIEANHPYIINVSEPVSEFIVEGVDIAPTEYAPCVSFGYETGRRPVVYHPADFIGTYVADFDFFNDAERAAIFLNDNKFWYATASTRHMKAFRAYFDFDDILTEVEDASMNVKMAIDGESTRIDGLLPETSNDAIYDLTGRKVEKAEKGIYIVNGKKVLK